MGLKTATFTEFYNETVTIKGNGYAVGGNGGLTSTPATKATAVVTKQPIFGVTDDLIGKPYQNCDWYFGMASKPAGVSNGDTITDASGVRYLIVYMEAVTSHLGSYYDIYAKEIRE